MPDTKITALAAITTVAPAADLFAIVDVSDNSMAASGTTKNITTNQILGAGGTATLASATISGDLTVDTSTLKVDSTNNRVGIGTATPNWLLTASGSSPEFVMIDSGANGTRLYTKTTNTAVFIGANYSTSAVPINFTLDGGSSNAMTLNSSGLFLGISSQAFAEKFRVYGSYTLMDDGAFTGFLGKASSLGVIGATTDFGIRSANALIFLSGGATERMRIDSSGNVGIGVTPSAWRSNARALQLGTNGYATLHEQSNGSTNLCFAAYEGSANVFNYRTTGDLPSRYVLVSGTHQWFTATSGTAGNTITFTQAMTLDASGRLLVGLTTSTGDFKFEVSGTNATNSYSAKFSGGSSTSNGVNFYLPGTRSSDTTYYLQRYGDDVATRFQIFGNGNVQNTTGTYGTISDLRLKENISDARNYLADLLKLRVVKYSLKADASPTANLLGLIAQEVEQVFPTLVETSGDDVKSVKTTVLIPMLLKAIQELTARVQTLETR